MYRVFQSKSGLFLLCFLCCVISIPLCGREILNGNILYLERNAYNTSSSSIDANKLGYLYSGNKLLNLKEKKTDLYHLPENLKP